MTRKEDIGKLIKKQFEGVEISPDASLWEKIDGTLQKRKKKKILFYSLFFLALIIGINSILFFDTTLQQNHSEEKFKTNEITNNKSVLESNNDNANSTIITIRDSIENKINEDQKLTEKEISERLKDKITVSKANKNPVSNRIITETEKSNLNADQEQTTTFNDLDNKIYQTTIADSINNNLETEISELIPEKLSDSISDENNKNTSPEELTAKPPKKWAITVLGGLNTYVSFNKSSLIHQSLDNYNRKGTLNYTYGFALRFDLSDNLTVSYGINKTTFSYFTQHIPASNESEINRILNYTDASSGQTISSSELSNFLQNESQTDLLHQTEYIELPLLFRYSLSSKRFGIHTLGGISTYLRRNENLYVQKENNDRLKIGSLNNLTGARFSLNLGVGLYYEISENLLIEINPTFKYSLSKYSSQANGDKPYFIGIFTGLTYNLL